MFYKWDRKIYHVIIVVRANSTANSTFWIPTLNRENEVADPKKKQNRHFFCLSWCIILWT